jgi:hypothetical protein
MNRTWSIWPLLLRVAGTPLRSTETSSAPSPLFRAERPLFAIPRQTALYTLSRSVSVLCILLENCLPATLFLIQHSLFDQVKP